MQRLRAQNGTVDDPNLNFLNITMNMIVFREGITGDLPLHPRAVIEWAQAIDKDLVRFAEVMPPQARFQSFRVLSHSVEQLAHEGYYHGTCLTVG